MHHFLVVEERINVLDEWVHKFLVQNRLFELAHQQVNFLQPPISELFLLSRQINHISKCSCSIRQCSNRISPDRFTCWQLILLLLLLALLFHITCKVVVINRRYVRDLPQENLQIRAKTLVVPRHPDITLKSPNLFIIVCIKTKVLLDDRARPFCIVPGRIIKQRKLLHFLK